MFGEVLDVLLSKTIPYALFITFVMLMWKWNGFEGTVLILLSLIYLGTANIKCKGENKKND